MTSRPLEQTELAMVTAMSGWQPLRYELRGFTLENVGQLAANWFQALRLPDPDAVTARFTSDVARFRVTELASTPLVASMLCQLRAAEPEAALPTTRGAVYQAFTDLLDKRLNAKGGILTQAVAALGHHGEDTLRAARHTLAVLPELIAHLAAQRRAGNNDPALDIIAAQPAATTPRDVPPDEWRDFLTAALRRSGLLDVRAGEFVFLHQTLADYLVARHDPDRVRRLQRLLRGSRLPRGRWRPPREDTSFVSFLVDAGPPRDPRLALTVERLATRAVARGGLDGCAFVATHVRLGTWLPDAVVAKVTGIVERTAATFTYDSVRAARILADIDRARGVELLESIALARRASRRFEAVRAITALDPARAEPILASVAEGAEYRTRDRVRAARLLAQLGNARGGELLLTMATAELLAALDTDEPRTVGPAVEALAQTDIDSADTLLGTVIANAESNEDRSWLATVRADIRARTTDPMADLDRVWLMTQLTDRLLAQVRRTPSAPVDHDTTTAIPTALLASLEDPRAADLLAAIAQDEHESDTYRWVAVRQLAQFRDPRAADLLLATIDDPAGRGTRRAQAGSDLVMLGDPRGMAFLETLAADAGFDNRASAVEAIAGWDRQRAVRLLALMSQDVPFWRLDHRLVVWIVRREMSGKRAVR